MKLLKNDIFLLSSAAVLVLFALLIVIWVGIFSKHQAAQINPKPIPVSPDFSTNYGHLSQVVPGKSTLEDVEQINGAPSSSKKENGKTYLYFPTPSRDFENKVLLKNGVVIYAVEHVFGSYKGLYTDYVSRLGNPALTLYQNGDEYPWYVFLKNGLALQVSNNYIVTILYFAPQNEYLFNQNVAGDLGFSKNEGIDVPESAPPE